MSDQQEKSKPVTMTSAGISAAGDTCSLTALDNSQNCSSSAMFHLPHYPIVWLGLWVALATSALLLGNMWAVQAIKSIPADMFIQSVVKSDGNLGWQQLCPSIQARLPHMGLVSRVEKQRIAESGKRLTLTFDFVGAYPRPQGGQIRLYVITAHRPNGWVGQQTYIVYTQASGCVEDIKIS